MAAVDVVAQALLEPLGRPGRSLLTVIGTVLGVGMLVAILGLSKSAQARINEHFNNLLSTEVSAQEGSEGNARIIVDGERQQVLKLPGVLGAGVIRRLPEGVNIARPSESDGEEGIADGNVPLVSASRGALNVIAPTMRAGRSFTALEEARDASVALLGATAAQNLDVTAKQLPIPMDINGHVFLVVGIISAVQRHEEVLLSAVIPDSTELALFGPRGTTPTMLVSTKLGYAGPVSTVLPATIYPADPSLISASAPPEPVGLREEISSDVTGLLIILAGVSLLGGLIGIANTTLVAVLERRAEIGLRRAIGARRGQVAMQFLIESLALGIFGGFLGDAFGLSAVAVAALAKHWVPIEPLWILLVAPAAGGITGLVAGVYPATRAARVDPATALAG